MGALKYCVLLVLLYSIPVKATTTVFHTNCTRPPSGSGFNFVAAPNTRGTLEILWSCLFTLLICTWQVQHLNVPSQDSDSVDKFWAKPKWMLITLFVPEYLVGQALKEFLQARSSVRIMKQELPELVERGGWTMTHAFYTNMFGFMVKRRVSANPDLAWISVSINNTTFQPSVIRQSDLLVLDTRGMVVYLNTLPAPRSFFTEAQIESRAKGDIFVKCIAGLQVSWFVVQVCARKARNLPISQLEVAVLAFSVCTLSSYLLWLKKPQDVNLPTFLEESSRGSSMLKDMWYKYGDSRYSTAETPPHSDTIFRLPFGLEVTVFILGCSVGGTIFGALHLLAWNIHFPTPVERILWRIFAIMATAIPLLMLSLTVFLKEVRIMTLLLMLLIGAYFFCRLFFVVETLRTLGYLPGGAFSTTWSRYVPHIM